MHKRYHTLIGALTLAALASCSAPKKWDSNRELLSSGVASYEAKDFGKTARAMDQLLVQTNGSKKDRSLYSVQRYYAAFMTARAHLEASFENAFLMEKGTGFSFGSSQDAANSPSKVGHLTAAYYHARYAGDWLGAASKKPDKVGPTSLLPPALEGFGIKNTELNLVLSLIAIQSKLQFQDKANQIITGFKAIQTQISCDEQLAKAQVSDNVRPWIYRGIFGYLVSVPGSESEAFRFAVRAIDSGLAAEGSISDSDLELLREWIKVDSSFEFLCPEDKEPADGSETACHICLTPYLEFYPSPRKTE